MHVIPEDGEEGRSLLRRVNVDDYLEAATLLDLEFLARPVQDGDMYLAGRNTGIKLLTAKEVNLDHNWVIPNELFYVYDLNECRAVVERSTRQ